MSPSAEEDGKTGRVVDVVAGFADRNRDAVFRLHEVGLNDEIGSQTVRDSPTAEIPFRLRKALKRAGAVAARERRGAGRDVRLIGQRPVRVAPDLRGIAVVVLDVDSRRADWEDTGVPPGDAPFGSQCERIAVVQRGDQL